MSFDIKDWRNKPDLSTPINEAALEDMERRLSDYTDQQVASVGALVTSIAVTASRTLALTDASARLRVNSASAVALTVPANADVAFPVGTAIEVFRLGTGAASIVAGSGVTVNATGLSISPRYASAALVKVGANEWDLVGGLA